MSVYIHTHTLYNKFGFSIFLLRWWCFRKRKKQKKERQEEGKKGARVKRSQRPSLQGWWPAKEWIRDGVCVSIRILCTAAGACADGEITSTTARRRGEERAAKRERESSPRRARQAGNLSHTTAVVSRTVCVCARGVLSQRSGTLYPFQASYHRPMAPRRGGP